MQPCCNVTNAKVVPKQLGERGELRIYAFEKKPYIFQICYFSLLETLLKASWHTIKPGTLKQGKMKHRTLA